MAGLTKLQRETRRLVPELPKGRVFPVAAIALALRRGMDKSLVRKYGTISPLVVAFSPSSETGELVTDQELINVITTEESAK